jgi:hypothetical protein
MSSSTFDRHSFPSGGWQFFQPQTNWSAPTPISSTFDQTVILIVKHRLQNPAITAQHNLATSIAAVGDELEAYTRQRLGLTPLTASGSSPGAPISINLAASCCGH